MESLDSQSSSTTQQTSEAPSAETQVEITSVESPNSGKSSKWPVILLLILLLIASSAVIYFFSQNQSLKKDLGLSTFKLPWNNVTCEYNGQIYQPGDNFKDINDCNTCSCNDSGQVGCTEMACANKEKLAQSNPTADWKAYSGSQFTFKYPDFYFIESNWPVDFDPHESAPIYVSSKYNFDTNVLNICPATPSDSESACILPGTNFNKASDVSDQQLDNKPASTFYVYEGAKRNGVLQVVQTKNNPFLEVSFYVDGLGAQADFNQILSTFKFTNSHNSELFSNGVIQFEVPSQMKISKGTDGIGGKDALLTSVKPTSINVQIGLEGGFGCVVNTETEPMVIDGLNATRTVNTTGKISEGYMSEHCTDPTPRYIEVIQFDDLEGEDSFLSTIVVQYDQADQQLAQQIVDEILSTIKLEK